MKSKQSCTGYSTRGGLNLAVIWLTVNRVPFPGIFQSGTSHGILNRLEKSGKITREKCEPWQEWPWLILLTFMHINELGVKDTRRQFFCVINNSLVDTSFFFFGSGPGLAIRVICAEDSYREKDFAETQVILKTILDYANAIKKVGEWALTVYGAIAVYVGCICDPVISVRVSYRPQRRKVMFQRRVSVHWWGWVGVPVG